MRDSGPLRLGFIGVLLLIAFAAARYGWSVPIVAESERAFYDFRVFVEADQRPVPQDTRIVLVVFEDPKLDRGSLVLALQNLDQMGAKAIGIDLLFSEQQDQDRALILALRSMKTPVAVGYAEFEPTEAFPDESPQYLNAFLAQLEGSEAKPASVSLNDDYNVTRLWPKILPNQPPVLGRRMLQEAGEGARTLPGYEGTARFRLPEDPSRPVLPSLSIDQLTDPNKASLLTTEVAGRYVLIGMDIAEMDRVATPLSEAMGTPEPPGVAVHGELIAQMLDGAVANKPPPLFLWAFAILFVSAGVLTGLLNLHALLDRNGEYWVMLLLATQLAAIFALPIVIHMNQINTYGMSSFGWLAGLWLAFFAISSAARGAGAAQRNFARRALGKYLPMEMVQQIIEDPKQLALRGEKKQIYVLFSDLEGFTKLSHELEPEQVGAILNSYLETLSRVVLEHGGVLDKFIGDAVVAFWGAPIAHEDDGMRAARAGFAMWQAGETFRSEMAEKDPGLPLIGKTRVGLHFGNAVVGNFGGESRIQYTALGDAMNTAARLEAANKALDTNIIASSEFADGSKLDWWRPMGRVLLRGRAKPIDLMEPTPDFPTGERDQLRQAMMFIEDDRSQALALLENILARHPNDRPLANLLYRTRNLLESGAYSLV